MGEKVPDPGKYSSVLYQICLDEKKMLFIGDIETKERDQVSLCVPHLNEFTYYCILASWWYYWAS